MVDRGELSNDHDVVVVGCGLAGMSAAMAARDQGASVLVLEAAPERQRGGNTAFSGGGFRTWHSIDESGNGLEGFVPDLPEARRRDYVVHGYSQADYYRDVMTATHGRADPELTQILAAESRPTAMWLSDHGVKWVPRNSTVLHDRKMVLTPDLSIVQGKGFGAGLLDELFTSAQNDGVNISYETKGVKLLQGRNGSITGVTVQSSQGFTEIRSKAVVLATGGFESNREWRTKYLGPAWNFVRPRGTRFNTGWGLRMALEIGAQPAGEWSGAHATAMDWDMIRTPEGQDIDGRRFSRNAYDQCIQVNADGLRFLDEGENWLGYTYVRHGRSLAAQPRQLAWQIFDAKAMQLRGRVYPDDPQATAESLSGLAEKLRMPTLVGTVDDYNRAVQSDDWPPDFSVKDGKGTSGITPPKSNWARRIDTPPFAAYKVAPGITFTFGGVRINRNGQVLDTEGKVIRGLYAAGNTVGGIWHYNCPGGSSLSLASVFGRIGGAHAAGQ